MGWEAGKKMKSRISPISVHCSTLPDFCTLVKSHLGTQVRSHPPPALAFGLRATWVTTSSDANNPSVQGQIILQNRLQMKENGFGSEKAGIGVGNEVLKTKMLVLTATVPSSDPGFLLPCPGEGGGVGSPRVQL